jgi:tagaturonate reductase
MSVDLAKQASLSTLSLSLLNELSSSKVEAPPVQMLKAPETILQLGWGKFMRGYVPDFVQLCNQGGQYAGRILNVQRSADYRSEAFARQNGLYTLILRGMVKGQRVEIKRIIGSVSRLLVADRDWDQVKAAVRKPEIRVILSNATETGLKIDHADTLESRPPRSFPGKLTQLLFERWKATDGQGADLAVIPTELVENNGPLVHSLVLEQARAWKVPPKFLDWIQGSVHVASTLVDRIVVGTPRPELLAEECAILGYQDDLLTCGEPYYLFAIQADEFTQQHFPMHLTTPNVRFVDDLRPYRTRKLRTLNGPQMVLSTLGTLLDFRLIYEALKDPQVGPFTKQTLWQEIIPAMGPAEQTINTEYARECIQRIDNPTIEHRLQGIRVDLTTKNSIRLFPSIRDFMTREGKLPERLLLTVAATLAVVLRGGLEDANAAYILDGWKSVNEQSAESILRFTRESLTHLSERSREPLDVEKIAPKVAELLTEIRHAGLRSTLSRRFSADQAVIPGQ